MFIYTFTWEENGKEKKVDTNCLEVANIIYKELYTNKGIEKAYLDIEKYEE